MSYNWGFLTICFSEYLLELSKLTASMWPKSISWPNKNMNNNLQTYFFFWYPSNVLSPLNLLRMFANSLLILLISASLLLPVINNLLNWKPFQFHSIEFQLTISDIRNEDCKSSHSISSYSRHDCGTIITKLIIIL